MLSEIFGHITYPTYTPILAVCIYMCTMHCTLIFLVFFQHWFDSPKPLYSEPDTHTLEENLCRYCSISLPVKQRSTNSTFSWFSSDLITLVLSNRLPHTFLSLSLSLLLFTLPKRFRATLNIFTSRLLWKVASPLQICHSAFTAYYVLYVARRCCDVWHALPLLIDPREKERDKDDLRKRKTLQALSKMM